MKNSYFITGGSGFLGRSIAINLAKDKNNLIKIFDNNYRGYKDLNIIRKTFVRFAAPLIFFMLII